MSFVVRPAEQTELDELAALWQQAWHDAHVQIVPTALTRPVEHLRLRLEAVLADMRVVGPSAHRRDSPRHGLCGSPA